MLVRFQGVPGAYSEAAAGKAYPNCEAVPCEQFDAAFEVSNRTVKILLDGCILSCFNYGYAEGTWASET